MPQSLDETCIDKENMIMLLLEGVTIDDHAADWIICTRIIDGD